MRPQNDDSLVAGRIGKYYTFIIADGLPGHPLGGAANEAAVTALSRAIGDAKGPAKDALAAGVRAADAAVRELSRKSPGHTGPATKLVTCLIDDNLQGTALDTGEGNCHLITGDTFKNVREAARSGQPPAAGPAKKSLNEMVSHVLGAPRRIKDEDFVTFRLGDEFLLLSSDGLTDHLSGQAIAGIVRGKAASSLDAAAEALVQEAMKAGSEETITVILVHKAPR